MEQQDHTPINEFNEFELQDIGVLELKLPSGKPMLRNGKPVRVHIWGPASEQGARVQQEIERRMISDVSRQMNASGESADQEEEYGFGASRLAAVTSHFENFDYPGGPIAIYKNRKLAYIARQVRMYWNTEANFFKG